MRRIAESTIDPRLFENRNVALFEDEVSEVNLYPLNVLRPSSEIRCGMGCLRDWIRELVDEARIAHRYRAQFDANYAHTTWQKKHVLDSSIQTIFINSRLIGVWGAESSNKDLNNQTIIDESGLPLIAVRDASQAQDLLKLPGTVLAASLVQGIEAIPAEKSGWTIKYADYIWDYMIHNPGLLMRQLKSGEKGENICGAHALREDVIGIDIIGDHPLYVSKHVRLWPGSVISTENGPIWIGEGTEIEPHCFLKGPLYLGEENRIKAGARLYGGSSFGPHCRLAGEISQSVFQGHVNKQHDGFIGNSILGQWVNLGADTTCSNLRNDYGTIPMKVGGKLVESGERFIGLIAGDHTKTGIHTMFNTGTVVGIGANVYGDDFPPRHIPSFAWGGRRGFRHVPFERTLEAARIAASRRGQEISEFEASLMLNEYKKMTKQETND